MENSRRVGVMENFRSDNILDWTSRQLLRPIVKMIKWKELGEQNTQHMQDTRTSA
jgi:hypothetical protein